MSSTPTTSNTGPTCRQCGQPKTAVPSVADPNVTLYTCERCEVSRPSTSSTDDAINALKKEAQHRFHENHDDGDLAIAAFARGVKEVVRQDREAVKSEAILEFMLGFMGHTNRKHECELPPIVKGYYDAYRAARASNPLDSKAKA